MRLFEPILIPTLRDAIVDKHVDSIVLATHGVEIRFDDITVFCSESITAVISQKAYTFDEGPVDGPWGLLLRQTVKDVDLESSSALRVDFSSGDSVQFRTVVGPYESVQITYPNDGDNFVMDIF
ncbi:MAG: hypothetical protein AAFY15_07175 [Cyanobacteria bacterium J06648_11]